MSTTDTGRLLSGDIAGDHLTGGAGSTASDSCRDKAMLGRAVAKNRLNQPSLELEVGLEPTTCALRGGSTESRQVPLGPAPSHYVLVRTQARDPGWTHWD